MMSFALFWLRGGFLRSMVERHASELKVWRHTTHKLLGVRAEGPKRSRLYKDACVQCARGELPRRTMWSRSCTADCQRQAGTLWPSGVGVSMPSRSPRGTTTRASARRESRTACAMIIVRCEITRSYLHRTLSPFLHNSDALVSECAARTMCIGAGRPPGTMRGEEGPRKP